MWPKSGRAGGRHRRYRTPRSSWQAKIACLRRPRRCPAARRRRRRGLSLAGTQTPASICRLRPPAQGKPAGSDMCPRWRERHHRNRPAHARWDGSPSRHLHPVLLRYHFLSPCELLRGSFLRALLTARHSTARFGSSRSGERRAPVAIPLISIVSFVRQPIHAQTAAARLSRRRCRPT